MNALLSSVKATLQTLTDMGLSVATVEVPSELAGSFALEGVQIAPNDSHLFIYKDAAGEILSVQNLPR